MIQRGRQKGWPDAAGPVAPLQPGASRVSVLGSALFWEDVAPVPMALELRGVSKRYGEFCAVDGLSLSVPAGSVYGFLGPNGAGKTTTLRMILGVVEPTSGSISILGHPSALFVRNRVGYLPEETYLYRFLTAEETLGFFGRLFRLPSALIRQRTDELISLVGLGHARRRRLGSYSKGMARRLGLAQALINDPDLVVLDEPTSGLDPLGSAEVKELIQRLKQAGKTVLLCSHLLADVEDLCDRIAILHQGKLQECGRVDDLLRADDRITIEIKRGDEAALAAVKAAAGDALIGIAPPRERLEAHFRKIIAKAGSKEAGK